MKTGLIICWAILAVMLPVRSATLESIISREHPSFNCATAVMSVGRDGAVYLASGGHVLRVSRDGAQRAGGNVVANALFNATANSDGVIATANGHFEHAVNLYSRDFRSIAAYRDFLVGDPDRWDAPARVEAGQSGDFYGLDQHRFRILRISPGGKVVETYAFPDTVAARDFRVSESAGLFLLRGRDGVVRGIGFDGHEHWSEKFGGHVDLDHEGRVYVLDHAVVRRLEPDELQPGALFETLSVPLLPRDQLTGVTGIAVYGDELIVKRAHETELFQVYELATGRQKRVVHTEHERLAVTFPDGIWTAGQTLPFTIQSGALSAQWRVWLAPLGDTAWRQLAWSGDRLRIPSGLAGLYQLRVAPSLNPIAKSESTVRGVVEIRAPGSEGTASVWTPHNRVWWGRGEEIPAEIRVRADHASAFPSLRVQLHQVGSEQTVAWSTNLNLTAHTSKAFLLPASLTSRLAPGRYELTAVDPNLTCVGQPIRIGPGLAGQSPFRITQHGDYQNLNSTANAWDFADAADDLLGRSDTLGFNQFVNRTFAGRYPLAFSNDADGIVLLRDLRNRLGADASGTDAEKASFGFPHAHALGAYGAHGFREWLLLVGMDAALPIGTSTSYARGMTPEEYAAEITQYTRALKGFAAFAGWNWVANWWVTDYNLRFPAPPKPALKLPEPGESQQDEAEDMLADLFGPDPLSDPVEEPVKEPEPKSEKALFEEALKNAQATGVWDPILDVIGDRTIGWQTDAQQQFKDAMQETAPWLATSSSGPYRRPEVYPPVSFSNVDEVDLHYQAEQIATPNWTAHATDFYKRPGKPAWMHPELWNDSGTGEQVLPMSWLAMMRGVDGIGVSGPLPYWGVQPVDARSGYPGLLSVYRALNTFTRRYGPWLMTLENHDRIAIPVSSRQIKLDSWGGIGGQYFTRLWEAFMACLYAGQPATFIYTEDAPDVTRFKALVLVGQRYEPEPALANLLAQARRAGLPVFSDGTCRPSLVEHTLPIGVAFDAVEKLHGFNNDEAYWEFRDVLLAKAPKVGEVLGAAVTPAVSCSHPEVLVSERMSGDVRGLWVVNNSFSPLDPGLLWRVQNAVATHQPVVATVRVSVGEGDVVYDVFAGETVGQRNGTEVEFTSDLRYAHARLYVILPEAISGLHLALDERMEPGATVAWVAAVPGINAGLPLHLALRDATGTLIEERFAATGKGEITVPVNVSFPVSLTATELISGKTAVVAEAQVAKPDLPPLFAASLFGPRLRDLAVSPDGSMALLNGFDWGPNLHALDLETGRVHWNTRVGDHFAYAPVALPGGFMVQGYDLKSGEGYHFYQLSFSGSVQRRFALPGLPSRLTHWAFSPILNDRINSFSVAADGSWIAGAGNLALAVWDPSGDLLWSQDWSRTNRSTPRILGLGADGLLVAQGETLTAYAGRSGQPMWTVTPDEPGSILGMSASSDGRTVAVRTSTRNGRVLVLRDGKPVGTIPAASNEVVVSPDGAQVVLTSGRELTLYNADGSLRWVFRGDGVLYFPRLSHDGQRLAVGSEMGTLYVVELAEGHVQPRDLGALPVSAWLPDGDLVAATWMGTVIRAGTDGREKWRVQLGEGTQTVDRGSPDAAASSLNLAPTDLAPPTVRLTSWWNAEPTPLPLVPNLLAADAVNVRARLGDTRIALQQPISILFDGQGKAPDRPWIKWSDIGRIDSGWRGSFSLEIEATGEPLRVLAVTLAEDPAHPESWLRDVRLEYWEPVQEKWVFVQYLTSDAPVHTHRLAEPVTAKLFRLTRPDGAGWPASNLRLAEIVFHGEKI